MPSRPFIPAYVMFNLCIKGYIIYTCHQNSDSRVDGLTPDITLFALCVFILLFNVQTKLGSTTFDVLGKKWNKQTKENTFCACQFKNNAGLSK